MRLHPIIAKLPVHEHELILRTFIDKYLERSDSKLRMFEFVGVDYELFFSSSRQLIDCYLGFFETAFEQHCSNSKFLLCDDGAFGEELKAIASLRDLSEIQCERLGKLIETELMLSMEIGNYNAQSLLSLVMNEGINHNYAVNIFAHLVERGFLDGHQEGVALIARSITLGLSQSSLDNGRVIFLLDAFSNMLNCLKDKCSCWPIEDECDGAVEYVCQLHGLFDASYIKAAALAEFSAINAKFSEDYGESCVGSNLNLKRLCKRLAKVKEIDGFTKNSNSLDELLSMVDVERYEIKGGAYIDFARVLTEVALDLGEFQVLVKKYPEVKSAFDCVIKVIDDLMSSDLLPSLTKTDIAASYWQFKGAFQYHRNFTDFGKIFLNNAPFTEDFFFKVIESLSIKQQIQDSIWIGCKFDFLGAPELNRILSFSLDKLNEVRDTNTRGVQGGIHLFEGFVSRLVGRMFAQIYLYPLLTGQQVDSKSFAVPFIEGVRANVFGEDELNLISKMGMRALCVAAGEPLQEALRQNEVGNELVIGLLLQERVSEMEATAPERLMTKSTRKL